MVMVKNKLFHTVYHYSMIMCNGLQLGIYQEKILKSLFGIDFLQSKCIYLVVNNQMITE